MANTSHPPSVDSLRIRAINSHPVRPSGRFILYWMTSARRLGWNFGLQHAVDCAVEWKKPLVILEALRCDYPHANDRLHRFVIDGMEANRQQAAASAACYLPYVEPSPGDGSHLLSTLASHACAVVTDWYPAFFLPRMIAAAGKKLDVRLEAVDSNGLIPLAVHGKAFAAARFYRAYVQRELRTHLAAFPEPSPLERLRGIAPRPSLPEDVVQRWPSANERLLGGNAKELAKLPIDHAVPPSPMKGGAIAGAQVRRTFVTSKLARYDEAHNHPDADGTSRLSPYLHFGHISAHEIFAAVMTEERWTTRRLGKSGGGRRLVGPAPGWKRIKLRW